MYVNLKTHLNENQLEGKMNLSMYFNVEIWFRNDRKIQVLQPL